MSTKTVAALASVLALSAFGLSACSTPVEASSSCDDQGFVSATSLAIHNGSRSQRFLELTREELAAVVFVQAQRGRSQVSCSGVLVDARWVVTANHCLVPHARMWVRNSSSPAVEVTYSVSHPSADVALLALEHPLANAKPLRFGTENVDEYLFSKAQVAGYGFDTQGVVGQLAFQVVTLIETTESMATVTGDRSGACFGDSGAPLISRAPDGEPVVLGTLSGGSPSCTGIDQYVRADHVESWLKSHCSPPVLQKSEGCAELREGSRCYGKVAAYCENGALVTEHCRAPETCGYVEELGRFGCTSRDPCLGVDALGTCDGHEVLRCENGTLVRTECGCGQVCAVSGATGAAHCVNPAN